MSTYVHGYSEREAQRLRDQAGAVERLLHHDTRYPPGSAVLEAGCGVGAQTLVLARQSPGARITSVDLAPDSLAEAERAVCAAGLDNVAFERQDLRSLPCPNAAFDHVFVCFVLEHLADPGEVLAELRRVLAPGGTLTVIEGDHGSCWFHPETAAARAAWQCLIDVQADLGGDSLIGRRLYPVLVDAGFDTVTVSPRTVYCDAADPEHRTAFVRDTITAMVKGVEAQALGQGRIDRSTWARGLRDLAAIAEQPDGTFCYTFFKAVAVRP